jgi:hypothetical protein
MVAYRLQNILDQELQALDHPLRGRVGDSQALGRIGPGQLAGV